MCTCRFSRWGLLLVIVLAAPAARGADRFYEDLLRDGILAADRGDAARAAEVLRLACFGLLEEPPLLARCLTHLALAQADLEDAAGFSTTVDRLAEIEQRFRAYSRAEIADADRQLFQSRAAELAASGDSEQAAVFSHGASPPASVPPLPAPRAEPREAVLELPADEGSKANSVAAPPREAVLELPANGDGPAAGVIDPVEVVEAPPPDLAASLARAQEVKLTADRQKTLAELERLRPLAAEHTGNRELQQLAGELAYRLSLWQESRDFFERGGVDAGRPDLAFLFAVTLYETGDRERAAQVLEPSLPQLSRNAFVDGYVEKILNRK